MKNKFRLCLNKREINKQTKFTYINPKFLSPEVHSHLEWEIAQILLHTQLALKQLSEIYIEFCGMGGKDNPYSLGTWTSLLILVSSSNSITRIPANLSVPVKALFPLLFPLKEANEVLSSHFCFSILSCFQNLTLPLRFWTLKVIHAQRHNGGSRETGWVLSQIPASI